MIKVTSLLIILLGLVTVLHADPQYYNYNNGTSYNSFPLNQVAGKCIQLYIAPGEFNQPSGAPDGNITKFSVRISTPYPLGPVTYTNFRIIFLDTTLAGNTMQPGWYTSSNSDTVFYRASLGPISAAGGTWLDFVLDHPHAYSNAVGLAIQIEQAGASGTYSGFSLQHTTTPTYRRHYSVGGPPFVYSNRSLYVPNCGIDVAPPVCNYSWASQTSGTPQLLYSVSAVNDMVGWAGGNAATVRRTTDGGATWTNGNPNPGVINGAIYAIEAFDANTAWCTTSPSATYIYRTSNGGTNWTQVFSQTGGFINGIKFNNANTGFAEGDPVGARWSLWKSTDGGVTWDSSGMYLPQAGSEAGWNNSVFLMGNDVWFGTGNTRVYHSTNFGSNWTFGATTGLLNSYNIHFSSATLGLAGGTTILRTTDGGTTYSSIGTPPGSGNINGIEGIGTNFWYVRGTIVYISTNSGDNWSTAFTAAGALNDVDFANVGGCLTGWAVGSAGTIAKMTILPVGIGQNNNQIPASYKLEQNYPNPFNPTTIIGFAIPKAGNVELKIYDVLGREAATVINEFRQPGSHTVEFDASSLSSGVYFYTIKVNDYTATKKMMLIK